MLTLKTKIKIFTSLLDQTEVSYADSFNADIDIYGSNYDYSFLSDLNTEEEIVLWISKLKTRIVMREDDSTLEDIIDDYISNG